MERPVFAVFDAKAEIFLNPVVFPNKGLAVRWFTELLMDDSHQISRFPEDFVLMEIGSYREKGGELVAIPPRGVVTALMAKAAIAKKENGGA